MATHHDQLGNTIRLSSVPKRIISLVPSQTELLYDLGLDEEVVGITKFCIHPQHWRKEKTIVGGTKNFNVKIIHDLEPDLIIGNKEENEKSLIQELQQHYSVWMSDINSLEDSLKIITDVGLITDRNPQAQRLVNAIRQAFNKIKQKKRERILYLIWKNPWMAAGSGTFIHAMIESVGWVNSLATVLRYPILSNEDIVGLNPDVVLLSSEPFPFRNKHTQELIELLPDKKILMVDGEMFSWYGSRLLKAPDYFNSLEI